MRIKEILTYVLQEVKEIVKEDLYLEIDIEILEQELANREQERANYGNTSKEMKSPIEKITQKNQQKIRELELEIQEENGQILEKIKNKLRHYKLTLKQALLEEKQKQQ